MPYKFELKMRY